MILFLDDDPNRTKNFVRKVPHATTVETACDCIKQLESTKDPIEILFLDHDLGGKTFVDSLDRDCGMEVVRWLENHKSLPINKIVVHTLNYPAGSEMEERLRVAGFVVERIPFIFLLNRINNASSQSSQA